jgi:uncharacterized membrane protein
MLKGLARVCGVFAVLGFIVFIPVSCTWAAEHASENPLAMIYFIVLLAAPIMFLAWDLGKD